MEILRRIKNVFYSLWCSNTLTLLMCSVQSHGRKLVTCDFKPQALIQYRLHVQLSYLANDSVAWRFFSTSIRPQTFRISPKILTECKIVRIYSFRSLQCSRISIHKNLVVSFIIRFVLDIVMYEPYISGRKENTYGDVVSICPLVNQWLIIMTNVYQWWANHPYSPFIWFDHCDVLSTSNLDTGGWWWDVLYQWQTFGYLFDGWSRPY